MEKRSQNPKIGSVLKVTWNDSHVLGGWEYDNLIYDVPHCHSIGTLLEMNDDVIVLVPTTSETGGKLGTMFIPYGAVKKIEILEIKS